MHEFRGSHTADAITNPIEELNKLIKYLNNFSLPLFFF